jgi:hypothetical protein
MSFNWYETQTEWGAQVSGNDVVKSLTGLIRYNNGEWKSEKQANWYRSIAASQFASPNNQTVMALREQPMFEAVGVDVIVVTGRAVFAARDTDWNGYQRYGGGTPMERHFYIDGKGVFQIDKVKFSGGRAASVETVEKADPAGTDQFVVLDRQRAEREIAHEEAMADVPAVPEGRHDVHGEIVKLTWKNSDWGRSLKMIVKSDEGWKVWGTVPAAFENDVTEGMKITVRYTMKRSDRDDRFAFGSTPSNLVIVENAEAVA